MFLSDNLTSIPIHAMRRDTNDPNADLMQTGAVNVKFLDPVFDNQVADQPVAIDIVHDDELTALDWTQQLWNLLSTRFYTPLYDYTIPASPVATGQVVFWNRRLRFRQIESPYYSHFHLRMSLNHHLT
jgi:hypothetical protein